MHYIAVTFEIVPEVLHHRFDWQTSLGNLCCPIIHQMLCALCGLVESLSRLTLQDAPSYVSVAVLLFSTSITVVENLSFFILNIMTLIIVYPAD